MNGFTITGLGDYAGVCQMVALEWSTYVADGPAATLRDLESAMRGNPEPETRPGTWVMLSGTYGDNGPHDRKLGAKAFVPDEPREDDPIRTIEDARDAVRRGFGGGLLEAFGV